MNWVEEEKQDVCSYAHDAVEQLLKENMRLKDENVQLREQITRLIELVKSND
jgi:cell division septum initiation protein DivIVA